MIKETSYIPMGPGVQSEAYLVPPAPGEPILVDGILTLGRSPECDIRVQDLFISARHCQLEKRPMGYFIRDLKSKNGVRVNGTPVIESPLLDGAEVEIGSLRFVFRHGEKNLEPALATLGLTSRNEIWQKELKRLPSVASSELPVFLQGESGAGKEVIAHQIHELSDRRNGPFISVNCSALTETLVESELFGHVRGSFTGATTDRKGAFEAARGGTLFLDEIGDLSLTLQPKLLRAIDNREIRPVGSDRNVSTDVRVISATHKNLEQLVNQSLFRADLFYRIHVIRVSLPPLRQRLEDFEDLFYLFCREDRVRFSVPAIDELKKYYWPGNIRELKNVVSRARAFFPNTPVGPEHLENLMSRQFKMSVCLADGLAAADESKLPLLKEVEREVIKSRLRANGGNQRRTAVELGIPKSTLHDRIKAYGIEVSSRRDV